MSALTKEERREVRAIVAEEISRNGRISSLETTVGSLLYRQQQTEALLQTIAVEVRLILLKLDIPIPTPVHDRLEDGEE